LYKNHLKNLLILIKLKKKTANFLITVFLISFFSFFITFNHFYKLSSNNNTIIIIPILIFTLSIISYVVLVLSISINHESVKKFFVEQQKILMAIILLILLYAITYFFIPIANKSNSTILNFIFVNEILNNIIFKNYIIFFLLAFIFNIFLAKQLDFNQNEIFSILLKFSIFFLLFAVIQNIIFFFNLKDIGKYLTNIANCQYFQFLPFGLSGKRNYEILPFVIGYALTLGIYKNKFTFINIIFFVACFLTYSKNLWIAMIILNLIALFLYDKIKVLKFLFIKITVIFITILFLNTTFNIVKSCNPNIKDYTIIKLLSLINLNNHSENLTKIKKKSLENMKSFEVYFNVKSSNNKSELNKTKFVDQVEYLLDSSLPRLSIYKESLEKISEKKFFGYGHNNYILKSNNSSNSESELFKILLDIGIIGFLLWSYLIIQLLYYCKSKWSLLILSSILSLSLFNIYSWFLPIFFILPFIIFFEKRVPSKSIL
tara:strand:- start:895 stop:2358 length:1464 start_codon:yes stop_codon:yes gene_type:complete